MPAALVAQNKSKISFYVLISFHFVGISRNNFPGTSPSDLH